MSTEDENSPAGEEAENPDMRRLRLYDFRRPDKFNDEQLRTLRMLHETFARLATTRLSSLTKELVGVHCVGVQPLLYEEYLRSVPNPTVFSVVKFADSGSALLELDPKLALALVDRITGGPGEPDPAGLGDGDLPLELQLIDYIYWALMQQLEQSWSSIGEITIRNASPFTNPAHAQIVPPADFCALVGFEVKILDLKEQMNLCIPYITIERWLDRLLPEHWYTSIRKPGARVGADVGNHYRIEVFSEFDTGLRLVRDPDPEQKAAYDTGAKLTLGRARWTGRGYETFLEGDRPGSA